MGVHDDGVQTTPADAPEELRAAVAEYGWVVVSAPAQDDLPESTSTVGLTGRGLPELLVLGLERDVAGALLHELATRLLDGEIVVDGETVPDLVEGSADPTLDGMIIPDVALPAVAVYGDRVLVRQLLWPDADGLLPGDEGFAHDDLQPLLPGWPVEGDADDDLDGDVDGDADLEGDPEGDVDWPLALDPHTEVLTSRPAAVDGFPVLMAYREADGGWLFLDGAHDFAEEQAVAECLHDVVERDSGLIDVLAALEPGDMAERDAPGAPWRFDQW